MFKNFDELIEKAQSQEQKKTIVMAASDDETMVHVASEALKMDLCRIIMVGDEERITAFADGVLDIEEIQIVDVKDKVESCLKAVELVSAGKGQILVKGNVNTSDFLRAVLNKEVGLRSGRKLNVLSCYEVPGQKKLFFMADGGMIIAPTLKDKVDILTNCIPVLKNMGINQPKVAILAANEKVSSDMPATLDAATICDMAAKGELPEAIYEGPIAFDVAMSDKAAKKKGIESRVSGDVDMLLVPSIETGNCLGKSIGYFGKGTMAGLVLGATSPIIMSSRAASLKGKLTSIAWAILACNEG